MTQSPHEARLRQGWQIHQAGGYREAEEIYREVLSQTSASPSAWVYLGIVLFDRQQFAESVDAYRRSLKANSRQPIAWNNLGNSYRMLGDVDAADECFEQALALDPNYLSAFKNRGTLWVWVGEIERGVRWYRAGLKIEPGHAELHRNLGVIALLQQDFDVGWEEYRWRWKVPGLVRPVVSSSCRRWNGESLVGKRVLLYPEQGLGDAIQFVRVAEQLRQRGAQVILHCEPKLIDLFSSAPGYQTLANQDRGAPPADFHASMIEVVDRLYQQTGEMDYGVSTEYLRVSDALCEYWRSWVHREIPLAVEPIGNADSSQSAMVSGDTRRRIRVGINWQGNPDHHADRFRSVRLSEFESLIEMADVRWVNLQFGYGAEQLSDVGFSRSIARLPSDVDPPGKSFTDSAAIVGELDGVITTDTAMAHLAAAVGTPVLLVLGKVPDWRWGLHGSTTPWYSSMRLVRQSAVGHWGDVMGVAKQVISQDWLSPDQGS